MKWFHDCLLPQVFQLLELCQTTSEDTCFPRADNTIQPFLFSFQKCLIFLIVLITGKILPVCFCYTAQWGWDSLHPQINLEGSALSAFYEENPPGDESWEYSQWQGRSCETGWFGPGWTFDGELWFHWGLPLSKSQHNKIRSPLENMACDNNSIHNRLTAVNFPDAKQKSERSGICLFPHCPTFYVQKMLLRWQLLHNLNSSIGL